MVLSCSSYLYVLLVKVAFSQEFECGDSKVGAVGLYFSNYQTVSSQGIVVLCIEVEPKVYQKAAVCWDGDSTFNEGAAAAACRQIGFPNTEDTTLALSKLFT